jgi:D-aspartate ligase
MSRLHERPASARWLVKTQGKPVVTKSPQLTVVGKAPVALPRLGVPVVLFGGSVTGLGAARILSKAGIAAYSVLGTPDVFRYSRCYRPVENLNGLESQASRLPELLNRLPMKQAVLMPCADDWVRAVAELPVEVKQNFPSSTPPLRTIEIMVDKAEFADVLQKYDIPHPATRIVRTMAELLAVPDEAFAGCFLKPVSSIDFIRRFPGLKGFVISNKAEAVEKLKNGPFPMMLQEFITGPPTAHYFLDGFMDRHGRVCGVLARRRLRMFPPRFGNSTLMVTIPLEEVRQAFESLKRLLDCVGYRGIFNAEFKYDERDGQFKILEVNARPWWYIEFAARSGLDVCSMAYKDALGEDVTPVPDYQIGRKCAHHILDYSGFRQQIEGSPKTLWAWLKSVGTADDPVFRWSDPLPAIVQVTRLIRLHTGAR